jgi:transposase
MSKKPSVRPSASLAARREYPEELKAEAVQMYDDGHSARSIMDRLGLSSSSLVYRWREQRLKRTSPATSALEARVRELEQELHQVERERDILKKALAIFGRPE